MYVIFNAPDLLRNSELISITVHNKFYQFSKTAINTYNFYGKKGETINPCRFVVILYPPSRGTTVQIKITCTTITGVQTQKNIK